MPEIEIVKLIADAGVAIAALIVLLIISLLFSRNMKNSNDTQKQTNQILDKSISLYSGISGNVATLAKSVDKLADIEDQRLVVVTSNTTAFQQMSGQFQENVAAYGSMTIEVSKLLATVPPLVAEGTRAAQAAETAAINSKAAVDTLVTKAETAETSLNEVISYIKGDVVNWARVEMLLLDVKKLHDDIKGQLQPPTSNGAAATAVPVSTVSNPS